MAISKSNFCMPLPHAAFHEGCLSLVDSTDQLFYVGSESQVLIMKISYLLTLPACTNISAVLNLAICTRV